jgi:hypothetical protein
MAQKYNITVPKNDRPTWISKQIDPIINKCSMIGFVEMLK